MEMLSGSTPDWEGQLGFSRAGDAPKHMNLAFALPSAIPQTSLRMVWQGSTAPHCQRGQSKGSSAPHPTPSSGVCAGNGETSTWLCPELVQEQLGSQAAFWSVLSPQQRQWPCSFLMELIHQNSDQGAKRKSLDITPEYNGVIKHNGAAGLGIWHSGTRQNLLFWDKQTPVWTWLRASWSSLICMGMTETG